MIVQLDIMRLEALHEALLGLRWCAYPAGHLQRRGGGRIAMCAADELGLPTEPDRARHLIARRFPKVKPLNVRGSLSNSL